MTNDKIEYELKGLYEHLHLDEDVYDYCSKIEKSLKERFEAIDQVAEYNQLKVIMLCRRTESVKDILQAQQVMGMMMTDEIPLRKYMQIFFIQRMPLCARTLPVVPMH